MSKVFEYSKIVEGGDFVGRGDEVRKLSSDFIFLTNTVLLAPQGYGKSSLIRKAIQEARHKEKLMCFCYVSLSNVRNEDAFYKQLVKSVLKAVSSSREEVLDNVGRYFKNVSPRIAFKTDAIDSLVVDMNQDEIRRYQSELLDLPYLVAKDRGCKVIVCIDDFHNISHFSDSEELLESFKGRWARHDGVAYCISASSNSMVEKFVRSAPMFYRYGDTIRLGNVSKKDMVRHIRERFADNAKYLDNEIAELIMDMVGCHAFYTQQLAHISYLGSSVVCSREVVLQAHETIVNQMGQVFDILTASLTAQQLCYLHAVLAGETVISTSEVLHRHNITSATSASRSKAALLEKGIICINDGKISFTDPIYAHWLKFRYFNWE